VLYLLETSYILVSIGSLNKTSFTTTFANEKCIIYNPDSTQVIKIPHNDTSLYKLIDKIDNKRQVNGVIESLILDQIYYCSGYIVPVTVHKFFIIGWSPVFSWSLMVMLTIFANLTLLVNPLGY